MKFSDAARNAANLVFEDDGRIDPAWVVKSWPYNEMSPKDIERINSGLMELEAFGLISHKPAPPGSILKEDIRLKDLSIKGAWPDIVDFTVPIQ